MGSSSSRPRTAPQGYAPYPHAPYAPPYYDPRYAIPVQPQAPPPPQPPATESEELLRKLRIQQNEIQNLEKLNKDLTLKMQEMHRELMQKTQMIATLDSQKPITTPAKKQTKKKRAKQVTGPDDRNLPQIGDHVVSMWSSSQWQYFTATIEDFDPASLKYTIEWDDGDPTGLIVDYYNLALDKVPDRDTVGVGSTVLFSQGRYKQQELGGGIVRSGGLRWHQGVIEKVYDDNQGITRYNGRHTKGAQDGKWITYGGYSEQFFEYVIEDFRMPPNVFDVMTMEGNTDSISCDTVEEEFDIFISYAKINCPSAIRNHEVNSADLPPSYQEAMLQSMCDPRTIGENLRSKGVRVVSVEENDSEDNYLKIVAALKKAKVFIACLSDEYASNERCRMEFQYAKKTLKLPVVPLVVGSGSFQWQMTVVGLLIAGDLYIHFKNKEVEESKMTELCRALKNHLPDLNISDVEYKATGGGRLTMHNDPGVTVAGNPIISGKADLFFSYCWLNSENAKKMKQVTNCAGTEWNDPRVLVKKLAKATGMVTWLDVERLEGASEMGMFGQIATALGDCKVVVACISSEYGESDNCRMEIQFAVKSLQKPTVFLVVGSGNRWMDSIVGKMVLLDGMKYFNLQNMGNIRELDDKIKEIAACVSETTGIELRQSVETTQLPDAPATTAPIKFKAPIYGDHVVCHHQKWAYYLATVVGWNEDDMTYEVEWDDGDPSGKVQSYENVALDKVPTAEEIERIGVGTVVFFQQGSYGATGGNNTGGERWHQGRITTVHTDEHNVTRYSGEHTKGGSDGKWVTYQGYKQTFHNLTCNELRLSPNAMDALMACRIAFANS